MKSYFLLLPPLKAKKTNDNIYFVEGTINKTDFGGVAFGAVDIKNKVGVKYSHRE